MSESYSYISTYSKMLIKRVWEQQKKRGQNNKIQISYGKYDYTIWYSLRIEQAKQQAKRIPISWKKKNVNLVWESNNTNNLYSWSKIKVDNLREFLKGVFTFKFLYEYSTHRAQSPKHLAVLRL